MMNKDISIYIHIPFCIKKCLYCDFPSFSGRDNYFEAYQNSIIDEINNCEYKGLNVKTIFIGGGTPSVYPKEYISEIADTLYKNFNFNSNVEFTIEANPKTINDDNLKSYINNGINRISIGLQSCNDNILKKIGRIHSFKDFVVNYESVLKSGFKNINIDLMFSLPSQTEYDFEDSLKKVVNLNPTHISTYSLIIEEDTPFYEMYKNKEINQTSDEIDRNMYYKAIEILNKNGYNHYEISNFSKPGYECKHNIVYWKRKNYIGFGLGAHSFIDNVRYNNTYDFDKYINKINIKEKENIDLYNAYAEYMFLGLRMIQGINIKEFSNIFKSDIYSLYGKQIHKLIKNGFLIKDKNFLKLTQKGIDLSNMVFVEFLP